MRKPEIPEYTILTEELYDIPIKTQITLNLLVSPEITKQDLMILLNHVYSDTQKRRKFQYHHTPTHIFIYAYTSKEYAVSQAGQWIAMLQKVGMDRKEQITINEQLFVQLTTESEEKFGLADRKRKQIFLQMAEDMDRADKKAYEKYIEIGALEQLETYIAYKNELENEYEAQVIKESGLLREQLREIVTEGAIKNWPLPQYPS